MPTLDRERFDNYQDELLTRVLSEGPGFDQDEFDGIWEKRYPKSDQNTVDELRFRGFGATVELMDQFDHQSHPERVPKLSELVFSISNLGYLADQRVWYPGNVDAFAKWLAGKKCFTNPTLYRMEQGCTWEQYREQEAKEGREFMERLEAEYVARTQANG